MRIHNALSVVFAWALLVLASSSLAKPQQQPTFRTETRAIEVDAFVTDSAGRFVRDLRREDFELLEDDEAQEIAAFTVVDLPVDTHEASAKKRARVIDSDVTTNVTTGRIYVMLLDSWGLRVSSSAYVKLETMFRLTQQVALRFVDEALGPNDLMAVIHVQESQGDSQAFTNNKDLLRASINRLKPDQDLRVGPYCDLRKLRNTYDAIEAVSERLGTMTGRRKAILWINGRVPLDPTQDCALDGQPTATSADAGALTFMHRDAMRAATRNNVAIYPIDSVGLTADPKEEPSYRPLNRLAALRGIAEETGGDAILNTNNFSAGYERIVRSNSSYYLLAYRPTRDHRDGRFHSITVRVRRAGLSVQARKGYLAPESGALAKAQPPVGVSTPLSATLANPFPATGLGLQLSLAPLKGVGKDASVVLAAEFSGLSQAGGAEDRVEISYIAIDSHGATRVAPSKVVSLNLSNQSGSTPGAVSYADRLSLPPGRHEVRMAVRQLGGPTGSVVAYVEVPDFTKDRLAMSGLVLAAGEPSRIGSSSVTIGWPSPTTRRHFMRTDRITAHAEVYSDDRTPDTGVLATVTTSGGTRIHTAPAALVANSPGRARYSASLPLADLTPGDYILQLEARTGRRSATRQVLFSMIAE